MYEEKQSSNKHINFGFLIAASATIAALVVITTISIQSESEPASAQLAQPGTQNENTTGTMMNSTG